MLKLLAGVVVGVHEAQRQRREEALATQAALAKKEAMLNEIQPYAGAMILAKMAALRDAQGAPAEGAAALRSFSGFGVAGVVRR